MTLYIFAFLSGLVTIFAPCIWPLLPIILASGLKGARRPFGIIFGLAISFLFVTLLFVSLLRLVPVDPEIFRVAGVVIILGLGITLLIPRLAVLLESWLSRITNRLHFLRSMYGEGFGRGFITGAALGVVWSPCAGPILATVATLAATQGPDSEVFFIALAFVAGISLPLLSIALLGRRIFSRMRRANTSLVRVQQGFGLIVICCALLMYTGYDKTLQARIVAACGAGMESILHSFEGSEKVMNQLQELRRRGEKM